MDNNKPLERWHGAHHYSNKVHLFFIFFLFFGVAAIFWSYFELSSAHLSYNKNQTPTPTPKTTCTPRPACFDSEPRCMMPETSEMCPPTITPTKINVCDLEPCPPVTSGKQVVCTQEAMLCPDGKTYVGRTGPNCEFSACPLN